MTVLGVPLWLLAALALALVLGAMVQTRIGLGLALVATPVVTLLAPALMPQLMIALAMLLPLVTLLREHHAIDWRGLGWVLSARVPGVAVGVALLVALDDRLLGLVVGVVVLVSVLLTVRAVRVPMNPGTLSGAGFLSGITGTLSAIGGPPVALLYQHRPAPEIRCTLAVLFTAGAAMSLAGIAVAGDLDPHTLLLSLLLAPALPLGVRAARVLEPVLPDRTVRPAVLAVCGLSSAALIVRSLV